MAQTEQAGGGRGLHRYAVLTSAACLSLLAIGGLVTSRGAGMSVPDWPTSYGYNMFALPFSHWIGGALYEHSHRLVATVVGLLVVGLTRWLGGHAVRRPLAVIGAIELVAGMLLLVLPYGLKGTGHFLMGIAGVVLLAAAVPFKNPAAPGRLPTLGWLAFGMVQLIGLLGGLRVVLYKNEIGIFHATLAQLFFLVTVLIAVLTSVSWGAWLRKLEQGLNVPSGLRNGALCLTLLVLVQLIVAATMRHQHAGLAIPDFPMAYGKVWPAVDASGIAQYNAQRMEVTAVEPITAFQVVLQMAHRILAVVLAIGVVAWAGAAWKKLRARSFLTRLGLTWSGLIVLQIFLGALTIWTNKAADIATLHMLTGALTLSLGGVITFLVFAPGLPIRSAERREISPLRPTGQPNPAGTAA